MRLGQLARKLAVRPDQIIEFLAKKNIQIEEGSNTRLEDDHVALVIKKFAPQGFDITVQEITPQGIVQQSEIPDSPPVEITVVPSDIIPIETPASEEKTEVIKAPKVELSGLKVVGKIDLPETRKKEQAKSEPLPASGEDEKKSKPLERPRSSQNRNPRTSPRQSVNPIALQREREEQEAQKKREEAKEIEREKRAQHYFKKVKVVAPIKAPKRDQIKEETEEPAPKPKTLLGRFFRWFTT